MKVLEGRTGAFFELARTQACGSVFLYGLVDPRTRDIRYVGKTAHPLRRLWQHPRENPKSYKTKWLRSLLGVGISAEPVLLLICSSQDADYYEKALISLYRRSGARLTNLTEGGDGGPWSVDLKERMRGRTPWNKGRATPQAVRDKQRARKLGRLLPVEHKLKISMALAGVKRGPVSAATRKILSEAHLGHVPWNKGKRMPPRSPVTTETRAKLSVALKGNRNGCKAVN